MPNPENVLKHKIKKGEVRNPHGRPKGTIAELKGQGLTKTEAYAAIGLMLKQNKPDLKSISESNVAPVWKVCIARAILKDIALGYHSTVESLFDRLFGRAKQTIDQDITSNGEPITSITVIRVKPK